MIQQEYYTADGLTAKDTEDSNGEVPNYRNIIVEQISATIMHFMIETYMVSKHYKKWTTTISPTVTSKHLFLTIRSILTGLPGMLITKM